MPISVNSDRLLVHLSSGGLAHMIRLFGNSLDYAASTGRRVIPHCAQHPAFAISFYDIFEPHDSTLILDGAEFEAALSTPLDTRIGAVRIEDLSLGWKGVPDYSSAEPADKSCYSLKSRGVVTDYPLALGSGANADRVQITTGEFNHTDRYKVSYSLLSSCRLSSFVRELIGERRAALPATYLAVHYRNSDDKREAFETLRSNIDAALADYSFSDIVLATDNLESVSLLRACYPKLTIHSLTPLIDLSQHSRKNLHTVSNGELERLLGISKRHQIGYALADLYCLVHAKRFVPSSSEFSRFATYLRQQRGVAERLFCSP